MKYYRAEVRTVSLTKAATDQKQGGCEGQRGCEVICVYDTTLLLKNLIMDVGCAEQLR